MARRSFFRANAARFFWNQQGTAVLALATADVDKTNQSYYGESSLHYLKVDGSVEGSVPLNKDGPVHDVQWSPNGKEFYAVFGFMPAKATLFRRGRATARPRNCAAAPSIVRPEGTA